MNYPDKSHFLLTSIKINDTDRKSSSSKKLLGVLIDNKLTFNEQFQRTVVNYMLWLGFLKANLKLYRMLFFFSVRILPLSLDVPSSNNEQQNK